MSSPELAQLLDALPPDASGPEWPTGRRIALHRHPCGIGSSVHHRDYAELMYMIQGSSRLRISGNQVHLDTGELLLLGQNTPLELLPLEEGTIAVSIRIQPEFLGDVLSFLGSEETPLREFVLRCIGQETPYGYLHFHVAQVRPIQNLMENLLLHLLHSPASRRAIPVYTVGLLFVQLLEESDKLTMGIREQQAVLGALRYLEAHYVSGSLTEAAQLLHCDITWLSREIKRRTGRTYTELLQERRLQQAAWLLTNTHQKIFDIALSVGYENVSYFHRIFRKRFQLSPKKYRDNS